MRHQEFASADGSQGTTGRSRARVQGTRRDWFLHKNWSVEGGQYEDVTAHYGNQSDSRLHPELP
jgi:hypothetical protein